MTVCGYDVSGQAPVNQRKWPPIPTVLAAPCAIRASAPRSCIARRASAHRRSSSLRETEVERRISAMRVLVLELRLGATVKAAPRSVEVSAACTEQPVALNLPHRLLT